MFEVFICRYKFPPMSIIEMIKRDHDEAREMMQTIALEHDAEEASEDFEELKMALLAHAKSEEEVVYPVLARQDETRELVLEARQEHRLAEQMLAELERGDASDEEWRAKFAVLKTNVEHHIQEEEKEILPKMKKVLPKDELEDLAEDFEEAKVRYEGRLVTA